MVSGELTFGEGNEDDIQNRITSGQFRIPEYFGSELSDLINRMLQPNSLKRISILDVLSHPW
jgi:serine/threonine protein kinase